MLITGDQLLKVVPTLKKDRAFYIAEKMDFVCPKYGISAPDILHEFIANVAHESGGFRIKEENMSYTAKRITQVWPSRFKNTAAAAPYERNPRKLANKVYGGRMGNKPGTDDGYNFRGSGFIQVTGRDTFEKYRKYLSFSTLESLADAMRTDDYYAIDSACWLFAVEKNLIKLAEDDQFITIVKRINGGTIGLTDRKEYYERAKKYIS